MCTTAAKKINNSFFLIKTRDPVRWMRWDDEIRLFDSKIDKFKKLIIQNPNLQEDGYYGGINEKGVSYVSTFVRTSEDQISYIRRPYIRLILNAKNAKQAVQIIKSFSPRIGGNMFVADKNECYGIEGVPEKYFIREVKNHEVKTNHFINLPDKNLGFNADPNFESWSKNHQSRAEEIIEKAKNTDDLIAILRDRKNSETKTAICTTKDEDDCFTHSAFVFDCQSICVYYSQGNPLENKFIKYDFVKNIPLSIKNQSKVKD